MATYSNPQVINSDVKSYFKYHRSFSLADLCWVSEGNNCVLSPSMPQYEPHGSIKH